MRKFDNNLVIAHVSDVLCHVEILGDGNSGTLCL